MQPLASFSASVTTGAGRGKKLGVPTINLSVSDIPVKLKEGIYACRVQLDETDENAVMHYGPSPVFDAPQTCEIHLLDRSVQTPPKSLSVEVFEYIRQVQDFESEEELLAEIQRDIEKSRAILSGA